MGGKRLALVLDGCKTPTTSLVRATVESLHVELISVPPGTTGQSQPLDRNCPAASTGPQITATTLDQIVRA
jgi:hypothetical protein